MKFIKGSCSEMRDFHALCANASVKLIAVQDLQLGLFIILSTRHSIGIGGNEKSLKASAVSFASKSGVLLMLD